MRQPQPLDLLIGGLAIVGILANSLDNKMHWTETIVILAALIVIAWVVVWMLQKWAAKPNEWESKIPPQPMQTEEMKPAEEKKPPILPPQKVVQPRPEQPKRK